MLDNPGSCPYICIMQVVGLPGANRSLKEGESEELRRLAVRLHRTLNDFVRQYQFRNKNEIYCYGITVSQCYFLETLAEKGALSMQELAQQLCVKISTVTRAADGLVKKRLVRRKKNAEDKRVVRVEMTEAGQKVHQKLTEDLLAREEQLLMSLSGDVREQVVDAITTLLHGIAPSGRGSCSP